MSEEERILKIADLLMRRISQREYAYQHRRMMEVERQQMLNHYNIITDFQRQLYALGYTGS